MNLSLLDPFQNDFPEIVEEYLQHRAARCVGFNRRGTLLAAGCADGVCVIWDFETRGVATELQEPGQDSPISSVSWSKCGYHLLAATSTGQRIVLWHVPSAQPVKSFTFPSPVLHARLSPSGTHALVSCLSSPPILFGLTDGSKRELPCTAAAVRAAMGKTLGAKEREGKGGGPGSRGGRQGTYGGGGGGEGNVTSSAPVPVVFNKSGSVIFVGTASGHVLALDASDLSCIALLAVPGGACIRQAAISRNGKFLLTNSTDRVLRVFHVLTVEKTVESLQIQSSQADAQAVTAVSPPASSDASCVTADSPTTLPQAGNAAPSTPRAVKAVSVKLLLHKEYQDAVNRLHWRAACFSGDSEFVLAGAMSRGDHTVHVWSREFGQLARILEGPRDALQDLVAHPNNKMAVSVAAGGAVLVWAQDYRESWTAFAPEFKELEENEEYVEREDEFDDDPDPALEPAANQAAAQGGTTSGSEIDIETVERAPALSDSDVSTGALLHLPVHPEASRWDVQEHGAVDGPASQDGAGREAEVDDVKSEHVDGGHWETGQAGADEDGASGGKRRRRMSEKALMALEDDDFKEPLRRSAAKKAGKPKARTAKQHKGDLSRPDMHANGHHSKEENVESAISGEEYA